MTMVLWMGSKTLKYNMTLEMHTKRNKINIKQVELSQSRSPESDYIVGKKIYAQLIALFYILNLI